MGAGEPLTESEKANILTLKDYNNMTNRQIAKKIGRSKNVAGNFLKNRENDGKNYVTGRPSTIASGQKHRLIRIAGNSFKSARELQSENDLPVGVRRVQQVLSVQLPTLDVDDDIDDDFHVPTSSSGTKAASNVPTTSSGTKRSSMVQEQLKKCVEKLPINQLWKEYEKVFGMLKNQGPNLGDKGHKLETICELMLQRISKQKRKKPELLPNFVINESSVQFCEEELNLLNKGLKFTPKPMKIPLLETVVDIETTLKYKVPSIQNDIRKTAAKVIDDSEVHTSGETEKQHRIIGNLKKKDVVYVKADKSNSVVILDKCEYERRVLDLIKECNYKQVNRNPLNKMIRETDELRQRIKVAFSDRTRRALIVSNPTLPKMYALPKTHKEGKKMRPIVSNIGAPSYKLAKWLVAELKKLPKWESFSVKNTYDFVDKVKTVKLNQNEIMTSFDVSSLFPSVPVDIALEVLENHLNNLDIDNDKRQIYIQTARLCMKHNFFQFRDKVYKVEFGTNMGNPLSPIIADLFMSAFEVNLKRQNLLPRVWHRYVDDVWAVINKNEIENVLDILNKQVETINFTYETEKDGKLPFLDLEVQRIGGDLEFAVYHKPTSTMRTIKSDSHCPIQHKMAAYHSMVHRLFRLPLNIANFRNECKHIKETARVNGFDVEIVDKLIYKHGNKVRNMNLTTLFSQRDSPEKQRVSFEFVPSITNKLKQKFIEYGMEIVFRNDNKLSNLLGSTKDKIEPLKKSGIYTVTCSECKKEYTGQTKRSIEKRFGEHCACIRLNHPNKSAVAAHVLIDGHTNVNKDCVKLKKQVNDSRRLDALEAFYIQAADANNQSLHQDRGNIESSLFAKVK
ncbi:uncharacterized protein LOC129570775 [Sitodiplosis mosellana]|uniref:uncharacterized protein LOC129570775 n=1 Tax=Sitodiplosis mosellana TaxID=263140 RepID=UPI0024444CC1|nr:uncharacterized protein LOC129570775 [Sitodiplosis mosellana]